MAQAVYDTEVLCIHFHAFHELRSNFKIHSHIDMRLSFVDAALSCFARHLFCLIDAPVNEIVNITGMCICIFQSVFCSILCRVTFFSDSTSAYAGATQFLTTPVITTAASAILATGARQVPYGVALN
jgi:hypothetical protein